jgi:hypothetical protein
MTITITISTEAFIVHRRDRASLPDTMAGGTRGANSEQIKSVRSSL